MVTTPAEMYCSASPSMYCQRSLEAKVRVSLDFCHPETAPEAGSGSTAVFLQPVVAGTSTTARAARARMERVGFIFIAQFLYFRFSKICAEGERLSPMDVT